MEPLLLIRADASSQIGTGHVMRCLALAQGWRRRQGRAEFLCAEIPDGLAERLARENMPCERLPVTRGSREDAAALAGRATERDARWVVVDGYCFQKEYHDAVRGPVRGLLVLDDDGQAGHLSAEFLLNQNAGASAAWYPNTDPGTRLFLGTNYALLREEFLETAPATGHEPPRVLVTLGGSDPENITSRVVEALLPLADITGVVVAGSGNPHLASLAALLEQSNDRLQLRVNVTEMAALMRVSDFAITAAGSTSWELAFIGVPSIQIVIAENQAGIAYALAEAQTTINLGDRHGVSVGHIREAALRLSRDGELRASMRARGRGLVDGRGAERLVTEMLGYSFSK